MLNLRSNVLNLDKSKILIWLVVGLILLLFYRGIELHLSQKVDDRAKFHAIPAAISVLYHHHPHDYTALKDIAMPFQGSVSVKTLIANAKTQKVEDKSVYYWVADDRGYEDYVIAAFTAFGTKVMSFYFLWFSILILSIVLFSISFRKQQWAMGYVCLILLALHLTISALPLVHPILRHNELSSVVGLYEPRFLEVLGLIPIVHLVLLAFEKKPLRFYTHLLPSLGQIGIFLFLYHARSSLGWEIVSVVAACSFIIFNRKIITSIFKSNKKSTKSISPAILILTLFITGLLGLNIYKHQVYNPKYFNESGTRTIWHNALMGLGQYDAHINKKYKIGVDDKVVAQAVINFSRESGMCYEDISKFEAQQLLDTFGGHGSANWKHYEKCAKKFFFTIVMNNKLRVLKEYFITKPRVSASFVINAMRPLGNKEIDKARAITGVGWYPLSLINLGFFILILFAAFNEIIKTRIKLLLVSFVVFVPSLIPSVAFYHSLLFMGGLLVFTGVILYLFLAILLKVILMVSLPSSKKSNVPHYFIEKKSLTIVIPAFNEEKRISKTICEAFEAAKESLEDFEIIVIDDGSSDATYDIATKVAIDLSPKIKIVRQLYNQGVGAAFHRGLRDAKFPYLSLLPGDNAFNFTGVKLLFSNCGTSPLIVSYRKNMNERVLLRYFLSRLLTHILRFLTGAKIRDAHSLYIFPVAEVRDLGVTTTSYGYHIEILSSLLDRLKMFKEVPVILNPKPDASSGVMKPKTLIVFAATIFKLFVLRFLGKLGNRRDINGVESYV